MDELFESLLLQERLKGTLHHPQWRSYSANTVAERKARLLAVLNARARVAVNELARELHVPVEMLRDWIYELVRNHQFTGYINWDEGLLYSAEVHKLRAAGRCPHCSRELDLAGKGVIRCQYCGAEMFL